MFVRRILVVGAGYVGLTTGACLASIGHHVTCADIDKDKIEQLRRGIVSILEPGLTELVAAGLAAGRLDFTVGAGTAVVDAEVVFLCVPTPMGVGGAADLAAVEAVISEIRDALPSGCVVVNKSTVPVGTAAQVHHLLNRPDVAVVSNPEFLREGSAVKDFFHPDRIVVGSSSQDAAERVAGLYAKLGAPTVYTDAASAEMVKYAANCFLGMKLSYVNAMAELCERLNADVAAVTEGMGYDRRIGQSFLDPGPGWGGSCLPKDTQAFLQVADSVGFDFTLLRAAVETNTWQQKRMVNKVKQAVRADLVGTRLALLGLTFKAGTNDLRDSPALAVAKLLRAEGADLYAYDPAIAAAVPGVTDAVTVVKDPYAAVEGAHAVVLLTEWPEFRTLNWSQVADRLKGKSVVDTRNLLDPDVLRRADLTWCGVGRPAVSGVAPHTE